MSGNSPPTADGYPLVRIAPQYLRDPFGNIDAVSAKGSVVTDRLLHRTFTGVYHPDPVETVLVTEASQFQIDGGPRHCIGMRFATMEM